MTCGDSVAVTDSITLTFIASLELVHCLLSAILLLLVVPLVIIILGCGMFPLLSSINTGSVRRKGLLLF